MILSEKYTNKYFHHRWTQTLNLVERHFLKKGLDQKVENKITSYVVAVFANGVGVVDGVVTVGFVVAEVEHNQVAHRCTVIFKFFWGGYLELWENLEGCPLFSCFIAFVWPNFYKSFEGAPHVPSETQGFKKVGHKNAIKHENRGPPPRFFHNHMYPPQKNLKMTVHLWT